MRDGTGRGVAECGGALWDIPAPDHTEKKVVLYTAGRLAAGWRAMAIPAGGGQGPRPPPRGPVQLNGDPATGPGRLAPRASAVQT